MTTIRSTSYCDDPNCPGHVTVQEHPGQRVVLTNDPSRPLALIPEEES